jgi:hypothetical protein
MWSWNHKGTKDTKKGKNLGSTLVSFLTWWFQNPVQFLVDGTGTNGGTKLQERNESQLIISSPRKAYDET